MSQDNTSPADQTEKPRTAMQRMIGLLGYLAGIGLLLFILFTILFSIWSIFATA